MDRWNGIERLYSEEDVEKLRGTIHVEPASARSASGSSWRTRTMSPLSAP